MTKFLNDNVKIVDFFSKHITFEIQLFNLYTISDFKVWSNKKYQTIETKDIFGEYF